MDKFQTVVQDYPPSNLAVKAHHAALTPHGLNIHRAMLPVDKLALKQGQEDV